MLILLKKIAEDDIEVIQFVVSFWINLGSSYGLPRLSSLWAIYLAWRSSFRWWAKLRL